MKRQGSGVERQFDSTMRKGMLKIVILKKINEKECYPYALLKTLQKGHLGAVHGMGKNDIYNAISSLEKDGLIQHVTRLSGPHAQNVYSLTKRGKEVLRTANITLTDFLSDMRKLIKTEFGQ